MKPRLLDLFCGAGGAARGYQRAGFYVVGVDNRAQPRYAGDEFNRRDVFELLTSVGYKNIRANVDVIHASPPCQAYSAQSSATGNAAAHPNHIGRLRELLRDIGLPYVIENVPRSPLRDYIVLCGTMFGLPILRHRWFEMAEPPVLVPPCAHVGSTLDGTYIGHAEGGHTRHGQQRPNWSLVERQAGLGIEWMSRHELREAIPPAYTEWIGGQLIAHLMTGGPAQGPGDER